jgi:6-phosphogluconolactonase
MRSLILSLFVLFSFSALAQHEKEILYVGTYSIRDSKGIYVYELNRSKGTTKLIQTIDDLSSPTFLAIHPNQKFLYAVNRGALEGFENSGSVTAYSIDQKSGKLTFVNHVASFGKEPCHISLDKTGRLAFISNYNEGNFVVLSVHEDGSLGAITDSKKYSGTGPNRLRQDQPHIHSAEVSADNRFVYVSDLGTDKIYSYAIDHKAGKITTIEQGDVSVSPGAGPRHFTFHPGLNVAYSAEELTSTVAIFNVNVQTGQLSILQDTVRSLPKDFTVVNTSADIHIHPKGNFLYLSNRGQDALAIYAIGPTGKLTLKGHQKTLGKTPRNFLIDKKGKFLWAANQNTDNIATFTINPKTGALTPHGMLKVPSPVCIQQLILR